VARIPQPKTHEPIRLIETKSGPRYRAVLDTAPKGAPRRQVTRTLNTLAEARAFVTKTRAGLAAGNFTAPSKVTLSQLTEDWLRSRRDIREVSRNGYLSAITPILDRVGERPAQSITRPEIERLVERLETEGGRRSNALSHRTIVYALGTLRQVLAFGVSIGVLASNPARDVKARRKRKGDRRDVDVWEQADLIQFREQVDADDTAWVPAAFRLTLCGLRRSEILGLSWDAVDLNAGTVRVEASRVKTGKGYQTERDDPKSDASARTVAVETIHPGTVAALRTLRAHQAAQRLAAGSAFDNPGDLVVVDLLGRGIHPEVYSLRFRALCKAAGVPKIRLHAGRHTLALMLHRGGVAPADAASMLGHTVGTHLSFYVPKTERGAATAATRLGELLAAN
jgi:integrase